MAVWEVFRQEREGAPFQHGGSLEAPNAAFADAYARDFYGRRAESFALWVVPRDAVMDVREPYVAAVFDRDYRRVDGYSIKVKLKEARERAGTTAG
jgi:ring-1,2-phenylacetyl-CoA epoxidase subunit PaaB